VLNDRLANDVRRNDMYNSGADDDRVLRALVRTLFGTFCFKLLFMLCRLLVFSNFYFYMYLSEVLVLSVIIAVF